MLNVNILLCVPLYLSYDYVKAHFSYLFYYNELLSELKLLIYNKLMTEVLAEVKCAWQSVYNLFKLEIQNQMYKITLINQKQQNT